MKLHKAFAACLLAIVSSVAFAAASIVGSLPLPGNHTSLAVDPVLRKAFIAHLTAGNVTIVDIDSMQVVGAVPIDPNASRIRIDTAHHRVYVLHSGVPGQITTIDSKAQAIVTKTTIADKPLDLGYDFQRGEIYVIHDAFTDNFTIFDTKSNTVAKTLSLGAYVYGLSVDRALGRVYVSLFGAKQVAVVGQASRSVIKTIPVAMYPVGIVADERYGRVFVSGFQDLSNSDVDQLQVIDGTTDTVRTTIGGVVMSLTNVGRFDPVLSAVYGRAYVASPGLAKVTAVDTGPATFAKTIALSGTPIISPTLDEDDGEIYVFDRGGDTITILDARLERVASTLNVGLRVVSMGRAADRLVIFATDGAGHDSLVFATPQYEETSYYVALPDAAGACNPAYEELYRLYNDGQGGAPNHAYTNSRAKRDALQAKGWVPEGLGPQNVFACTPPLKGFVTTPP